MEIHDALPIDAEFDQNEDLRGGPEQAVPGGLKNREFNLKTAALIRSQIGDIEEVRKSLGLSKRKICQLLLIDPSTWTRWATGKTTPPPYIYRMLQWGLAVMDKYPETHPLANYEKFEQLKKLELLEEKLNGFMSLKVEGLNEKPQEKQGGSEDLQFESSKIDKDFLKHALPLSILALAGAVLLKS